MRMSYEEVAACLDLSEVVLAGISDGYEDAGERYRAVLAASELLEKGNLRGTAGYLRRWLQNRNRSECLEAGVCPDCGGDVTMDDRPEPCDNPFGYGTAMEKRRVYVCETCGEVD